MDRAAFGGWLDRYFAAWASNDPDSVDGLFAHDAEYFVSPLEPPRAVGREAIVRMWTEDPDVQEDLRTEHRVVAVEGDVGVAHWRVSFLSGAAGPRQVIDGILVIDFDANGRCVRHREWFERGVEGPSGG